MVSTPAKRRWTSVASGAYSLPCSRLRARASWTNPGSPCRVMLFTSLLSTIRAGSSRAGQHGGCVIDNDIAGRIETHLFFSCKYDLIKRRSKVGRRGSDGVSRREERLLLTELPIGIHECHQILINPGEVHSFELPFTSRFFFLLFILGARTRHGENFHRRHYTGPMAMHRCR